MLTALSLFSGIGGLDLAAEMAGIEVKAFCEIELFPVEVLKKRFPGVPIFEDVKTLTKESFMEAIKKEDKYANVVESYERGKSIQQIAAEKENEGAMVTLGVIYRQEKNNEEAKKWYLKAIAKDSEMAMYNLGLLLIEYEGNIQEGKKYMEMAAKRGDKDAKKYLSKLGD